MDKFSSGKSGLHCTQTAMSLALAKKLPHPKLRKQMFTEYLYLPRIWARPPQVWDKAFSTISPFTLQISPFDVLSDFLSCVCKDNHPKQTYE